MFWAERISNSGTESEHSSQQEGRQGRGPARSGVQGETRPHRNKPGGKTTGRQSVTSERTDHPAVRAETGFQGIQTRVVLRSWDPQEHTTPSRGLVFEVRSKRATWQEGRGMPGGRKSPTRWKLRAGGSFEWWPPKGMVHVVIPRSCEYDLMRKKGLCRRNYVKDSEMRSSRITWVGPKPNTKCSYKRQKRKREVTHHGGGRDWREGAKEARIAGSRQFLQREQGAAHTLV